MRKMIVLTLLMLMLGMSGLAQAQMIEVPCADLAESDCEILRQAQQANFELESYDFQLNVDLVLANIPDAPPSLALNLAGTGSLSGDWSQLQQMSSELTALVGDPAAYAELMEATLGQMDADINLVLTLPQELVAEAGGQIPASIPLQLRMVDGVAYLNFDAISDALGEDMAQGLPPGWMGIDIVELASVTVEQQAATSSMSDEIADMQAEMMSRFTDPEFLNSFMSIERLDDVTAEDGTQAAVFHTTIDYSALMSDPAMQDMMRESMMESGELTEADMDMALETMGTMFEGLQLEMVQTIGLEDFYPRAMEFTFAWDLSSMQDALGSEMGSGPAPTFTLNGVMTYSNFNAAAEITEPENATIIPLESLGMGAME